MKHLNKIKLKKLINKKKKKKKKKKIRKKKNHYNRAFSESGFVDM